MGPRSHSHLLTRAARRCGWRIDLYRSAQALASVGPRAEAESKLDFLQAVVQVLTVYRSSLRYCFDHPTAKLYRPEHTDQYRQLRLNPTVRGLKVVPKALGGQGVPSYSRRIVGRLSSALLMKRATS